MTQKILHASGTFAANTSGATEVAGGDLTDGSDATYIEGTSSNGVLGYTVGLQALTGYESGDPITLHIRLSLTGGGDPVDATAQVFVSPDASPDLTEVGGFSDGSDSGFGFAVPLVDGTIQDFVVPLSMGAWSTTEADVVAALEAGAFLEVNAIVNRNAPGSFVSRVYEAWVAVGEDSGGSIELPCDTDVALDLSTLTFFTDAEGVPPGPYGQFSDGVIWPVTDALGPGDDGFPDFYAAGLTTEAKPYEVTITFDGSSPHDEGGRQFWITALPSGGEQAAYSAGTGWTLGNLYNGSANADDTATVVVNPDAGVNFWFETDHAGAVSAITVRKICTDDIPAPPIEGAGPGSSGDQPTDVGADPSAPTAGSGPPPSPSTGGGFLAPGRRRQAPTKVDLVIDGQRVPMLCNVGGPKWSHVWPGGSANASWEATDMPQALTRRGLLVELMFGGECIWSGPQTDAGNAVGLWTVGVDYAALDGSGDATTVPDTAVDQAIERGLPWLRRDSISTDPVDLDVSQGPATIGALLDAYADAETKRWGVDPNGYVYAVADPTDPSAVILPLDQPLAPGGEDFATALIGRYYNGTDYVTTSPVTDATSVLLNGYHEATVDLTGRGTLTGTKATNLLKALLALGKSQPSWASSVTLGYDDILSPGGVPVALESVRAGQVVRVLGFTADAQVLGGSTYVDVLIGQSDMDDGGLVLTPFGAPARSLVDMLAQIKRPA